jgi:hypothetical protein
MAYRFKLWSGGFRHGVVWTCRAVAVSLEIETSDGSPHPKGAACSINVVRLARRPGALAIHTPYWTRLHLL